MPTPCVQFRQDDSRRLLRKFGKVPAIHHSLEHDFGLHHCRTADTDALEASNANKEKGGAQHRFGNRSDVSLYRTR